MEIQKFTFNAFSENTYLLYEGNTGIVVDPGMSNAIEEQEFEAFVTEKELNISRCILTHCHIDHVMGTDYIKSKYGASPEFHKEDQITYENNERVAAMYGVPFTPSPTQKGYLDENDKVILGETTLEIRFVPGHAPGHIVFIDHDKKNIIAGDTLFQMSIGRTDLPGGNHEQLLSAIRSQLFTLPDDYVVYCGHGPETNIGFEKTNNPFLKG